MIGPRIAALRKSAGMSQAELARALQVSPSAVGMYEQGRREPSAVILVALSRLFGVSTDFLLTGQPARQADTQLLTQVLEQCLTDAARNLSRRREPPFTRQELAVLFAAMLEEA